MLAIHNNVGSTPQRIETRSRIEFYCNLANLLPVHEQMLYHLYFKHGYSTIAISQLLMVHHTTVARRLKAITKKLNIYARQEHLTREEGLTL